MSDMDDLQADAEASRWDHAEEPESEEGSDAPEKRVRPAIAEKSVLRVTWVGAKPLPEDSYRPLCQVYTMADRYCEARGTHMVTVRVRWEDCCADEPFCACGCYAEITVCERHARRYERTS